MTLAKKPTIPGQRRDGRKTRYIGKKRNAPSPVRLEAEFENDPDQRPFLPTLVFKRRYPSLRWIVPAVKTPLYWFDKIMFDKGLITRLTNDTVMVDGRRFKVLCQDYKESGRHGYTRWLCYEESAVGKDVQL